MFKALRFLLLVIVAGVFSQCSPDTRPYKATFRVILPDGRPVQNAFIYLYTPIENSLIDGFIATNESGEATFSYQHKAIVKYEAGKASFKRCDVVELQRGNIYVEVTIYPENDPRRACK
ncbi:MAG: hypothetical protein ACK4KT_00905 [Thermaurantimonas sp.]